MSETSRANMLVYRDGRQRVPARNLVRQLADALEHLRAGGADDSRLTALLSAGELECALCDAESHEANAAIAVTDALAAMVFRGSRDESSLPCCHRLVNSMRHEGELPVSRPEGFAYYALHPLDFADAVSQARIEASHAYVVGIRSIGTTLSAVVAASLNATGIAAGRTTVRPEGHPYDRHAGFTCVQSAAVRQALAREAVFLVCDEGPGRSGSSLLSVAEALEREGVNCDRIILLCSHQPNLDSLCADNAARRWSRYRTLASGMTKRLPQQAGDDAGGGRWRALFFPHEQAWPCAWPQMERLKFLSHDRLRMFKFEGHGPYGETVGRREQLLAADGFGAPYLGSEAGFGIHHLVRGESPAEKVSRALLSHVAKYCAWRATELSATVSQGSMRQLEQMAKHNLQQGFGFASEVHLEVERPVVCDARMQRHEWLEVSDGRWLKLDASTHGDDHFFPGPTDIAWDLAGVCVEWQLRSAERELLLSEYRRLSDDDAAARLKEYEIAYAAFRLGWSGMAAASVGDSDEASRLSQDATRYRAVLDRLLAANAVPR